MLDQEKNFERIYNEKKYFDAVCNEVKPEVRAFLELVGANMEDYFYINPKKRVIFNEERFSLISIAAYRELDARGKVLFDKHGFLKENNIPIEKKDMNEKKYRLSKTNLKEVFENIGYENIKDFNISKLVCEILKNHNKNNEVKIAFDEDFDIDKLINDLERQSLYDEKIIDAEPVVTGLFKKLKPEVIMFIENASIAYRYVCMECDYNNFSEKDLVEIAIMLVYSKRQEVNDSKNMYSNYFDAEVFLEKANIYLQNIFYEDERVEAGRFDKNDIDYVVIANIMFEYILEGKNKELDIKSIRIDNIVSNLFNKSINDSIEISKILYLLGTNYESIKDSFVNVNLSLDVGSREANLESLLSATENDFNVTDSASVMSIGDDLFAHSKVIAAYNISTFEEKFKGIKVAEDIKSEIDKIRGNSDVKETNLIDKFINLVAPNQEKKKELSVAGVDIPLFIEKVERFYDVQYDLLSKTQQNNQFLKKYIGYFLLRLKQEKIGLEKKYLEFSKKIDRTVYIDENQKSEELALLECIGSRIDDYLKAGVIHQVIYEQIHLANIKSIKDMNKLKSGKNLTSPALVSSLVLKEGIEAGEKAVGVVENLDSLVSDIIGENSKKITANEEVDLDSQPFNEAKIDVIIKEEGLGDILDKLPKSEVSIRDIQHQALERRMNKMSLEKERRIEIDKVPEENGMSRILKR